LLRTATNKMENIIVSANLKKKKKDITKLKTIYSRMQNNKIKGCVENG